MNTKWFWLCLLSVVGLVSIPAVGADERFPFESEYRESVPEGGAVDLSSFYQALSPYGNWVQIQPYGWVWYPTDVPADWRPYSDGQWVYTDDYGWVWQSDLEWGSIPFHYGRWLDSDDHGWVWIPGTEWAPAWVAWRDSDDYIGWAPLGPDARWDRERGLLFSEGDFDRIPAHDWVFVHSRDFAGPVREHEIIPGRNVTILAGTHNATKFASRDNRVINEGVNVQTIEKATGKPVSRVKVENARDLAAAKGGTIRDGNVLFYRPTVNPAPEGAKPSGTYHAFDQSQLDKMKQLHKDQMDRLAKQQEADRKAFKGNDEQWRKQQEAEQKALQQQHERAMKIAQNRMNQGKMEYRPSETPKPEANPPERPVNPPGPPTNPPPGPPPTPPPTPHPTPMPR